MLDQVDIDFLEDLQRAWEDWPPLRKTVAAFFGHEPKERGNLADLLNLFPDGTIR